MNFPNRDVLIIDVSKWQGKIDFAKMRAEGVDGVIIKCGQGNTKDPMFDENWRKAKEARLLRGSYWYFDSRFSPGSQARLWWEWHKDDDGELPDAVDYEETYNGPYPGWHNVKKLMEEYLLLSEYEDEWLIFYTSYYYWIAHSPTTAANLAWFAKYQLWEAWYTTNPAVVIIPKPWTIETLWGWQYGTNGVDGKTPNGQRYGAESIEIDESNYNGTEEDFYSHYAGDTPPPVEPPTETEEIMTQGTIKSFTNIRETPNKAAADLGDLLTGDVVEWLGEYIGTDGLTWAKLVSATRNGAPVLCTDGSPVAGRFAWRTNIQEIVVPPAADGYSATFDGTFTLTDAAGKKYNAHVVLDVPLDPQV